MTASELNYNIENKKLCFYSYFKPFFLSEKYL